MSEREGSSSNLPMIQFAAQPDNFGSRMVGEVYQQIGPFEWKTHDWNNDGDVYDEKVAKFQKISDANPHSPNYFCLTEWEFRDLMNEKCIAYYLPLKTPLRNQVADAKSRETNNKGGRGYQKQGGLEK